MIGGFTSNEYKNVIVDNPTYDQKSKEWARIANPRQRVQGKDKFGYTWGEYYAPKAESGNQIEIFVKWYFIVK